MTRLALDSLVPTSAYLESRIDLADAQNTVEHLGHLLEIQFEDLEYEDEFIDNYLQAYWPGPSLKDWHQLEGFSIAGDKSVVDTFYYVGEFEPAKETHVLIGQREKLSFRVNLRVLVDLPYKDNAGQIVAVELRVPYRHLIIGANVLDPGTGTAEQAREIAARHVDLAHFEDPVHTVYGFAFKPRE